MTTRTRAICILVLLACGFTVISLNLIQIMLVQHDKFERLAIGNHLHPEMISPHRGAIFDSESNVLAETLELYDVHLDGQRMKETRTEAYLPRVAEILECPPQAITRLYNPRNRYQLIAHGADDAMVTRLKGLKLESLIFAPFDRRSYPNNELASHLLGFVDDSNHGMAGVEKQMDKLLAGQPGERWVERDARHNEIAGYQTRETPAVDGYDLTLSVKLTIQHVVEEELNQIVENYQPHAAYIIVMNPQTGEIMAMGSRPTFDPNDRKSFTTDGLNNRCLTDTVEPGSIFKIITLAGALNEHLVNLDTQVFCENGSFFYGGKELRDDEKFGTLSVEEALAKSSNIGFAKVAMTYLHEDKLYKYASAFGIGQRTNLFQQQGESGGILRPVNKWSALSITRIPMGQEVGATPLQMVDAMCVVANGGRLMQPMLVSRVTDSSGQVQKVFEPRVIRQVISPSTAREVQTALHQVTVDGTAKDVKVKGYSYGGKTGTAQKFVDGAYSHTKFVSSFIGFLPADNPQFVALVMVDEPQTKHYYGAEVSAPVFADLARQVAQILNIPEDQPGNVPNAPALSSANQLTMKLNDLLQETKVTSVTGPVDRRVHELKYDSRRVEPNDVFFAWKGKKFDGHRYIPEVCDRGAAAVVLEDSKFIENKGPTFIEVPNARRAMATMSASFFGRPDKSLKIIGVTGTNGKTTTTFILKHLLSEPKVPVGLIGTVRYEVGDRILPAARTTPESLDLHALLAQMRDAHCRAAVMEVSSHALEQGRTDPIEFQVGVFTNLTQDHLDYHESMENYFLAKALLFTNLDRKERPGIAVINADDPYGQRLMKLLKGRVRVMSYSVGANRKSDIEASNLSFDASGTRGTLRIGAESYPLELPLLGSYNAANALAAVGASLAFGIPPHVIWERLKTTPQVPGRLEKFMSKDGVTAVVDYAHTDDAVRKALAVLRGITLRRLIVVLGCGGNRDAVKRPLMARAAAECADYAIFTADNPRHENVELILDHMAAGLRDTDLLSKCERVADRRQAIAHALAVARPGDVVCVAGKGHETTQEIAGQFHPFDDRLVVQEFLRRRSG